MESLILQFSVFIVAIDRVRRFFTSLQLSKAGSKKKRVTNDAKLAIFSAVLASYHFLVDQKC